MGLFWRSQEHLPHGLEVLIWTLDLGTVIARVVLIEGDQPNVFMPNLTWQENLCKRS